MYSAINGHIESPASDKLCQFEAVEKKSGKVVWKYAIELNSKKDRDLLFQYKCATTGRRYNRNKKFAPKKVVSKRNWNGEELFIVEFENWEDSIWNDEYTKKELGRRGYKELISQFNRASKAAARAPFSTPVSSSTTNRTSMSTTSLPPIALSTSSTAAVPLAPIVPVTSSRPPSAAENRAPSALSTSPILAPSPTPGQVPASEAAAEVPAKLSPAVVNAGLVPDAARRGEEIIARVTGNSITRNDLDKLEDLTELNDSVIDAYMQLISERSAKTYCYSTYFFSRLLKDGYSGVKRWTKNVDIFSYDVLLIPIHLTNHWCMVTIDFIEKKFQFYDSLNNDNEESLRVLHAYIQSESQARRGLPFDSDGWVIQEKRDIPLQRNDRDCGVFACWFARCAAERRAPDFTQDDIPRIRRQMKAEILALKLT